TIKDVCDLQPRVAHGRPVRPRVGASSRSMVPAGRVGWLRYGSWHWRRGYKAPWCRAWRDPEGLNRTHIDILLEEVRGEAVPQCMRRDALLDPRGLGGGVDGTTELAGPTAVRPDCDRETASLPAAAGCVAAPPATRRAAVRAAVATALHGGLCRPCRARRAAACVWNRYRRP